MRTEAERQSMWKRFRVAFNQRRLSEKEDGERSFIAIITCCVVDNGPLIKSEISPSKNEDVT